MKFNNDEYEKPQSRLIIPFTDITRRGRSEESLLRVSCEWPQVPFYENGDCEVMKTYKTTWHVTRNPIGWKMSQPYLSLHIYIQGYSYLTRNGCFLRFPQIRDINEASKGSDFNQLGFRQPMKIWEKYQHILYNKGIMKISLCNL